MCGRFANAGKLGELIREHVGDAGRSEDGISVGRAL